MLFKQLHFLRIVRALRMQQIDMHMRVQVKAWSQSWSSDEDMCERMQIVKSTSKIMKMKDLKTKTTREPKEKETHTPTRKKKGSHVRRRRSCLPCRHTPCTRQTRPFFFSNDFHASSSRCMHPTWRERERESAEVAKEIKPGQRF